MAALFGVVFPVFLVIAAGYVSVRAGLLRDVHIDGLMSFAQSVAIPCLLFQATMTLDFSTVFDAGLLTSFYAGATTSFFLGILGARLLFRRRPGEAVAIGFGALFSNSVMLGLPIIERAYGTEALAPAFAIVAMHAPFCYALGITVMEVSRADGRGPVATARQVVRMMFRNALMIGIACGVLVNLSGVTLPVVATDALDLIVRAALPVALFGMGAVLTRYGLEGAFGEVWMTASLSLIVHPAITYFLATAVFDLPTLYTRAAVLTAAMSPGINSYLFASLYNRAVPVAASTVIMCTLLSLISVSVWLSIL